MTNRTITAVFADRAAAEQAARELATRVGGVRGQIHQTGSGDLGGLGLPTEDRVAYTEAMRRGQVVLSADTPSERFDAVARVLEDCGAVDFEQQEAGWRAAGWEAGATQTTQTGSAQATERGDAAGVESGTIPVAEEHLRVGKRETQHGRVRLRSYVVETPVEEQVRLREERVDLERRPVDSAATPSDQLFQERTLEATESAEEAVVQKEVRVTEEVALRKRAEERVETVRDTVRHTEVKVEDDRAAATRRDGTGPARGT